MNVRECNEQYGGVSPVFWIDRQLVKSLCHCSYMLWLLHIGWTNLKYMHILMLTFMGQLLSDFVANLKFVI